MSIEPTYITFEQAKWIKEKGFKNIEIDYGLNQMLNNCNPPEQWEVVEWLRVNHGIWVFVGADAFNKKKFWGSVLNLTTDKNKQTRFCSTPQEAYSAAFDYIKDNNLI